MKVFRIVSQEFAEEEIIWSGFGAKKYGGRWNNVGIRAIYSSLKLDVCVAEKGFYSIIQKLDQFSLNKNPTMFELKSVVNQYFFLVEIEIDKKKVEIPDLSIGEELKSYFPVSRMNNFKVEDSRKSPYFRLPGRWTMELGSHLNSRGLDSFLVKSARSNLENNLVIFPEFLNPDKFKVLKYEKIYLSAINKKNQKWNGNGDFQKNKIMFETTGENGIVEILNFPL